MFVSNRCSELLEPFSWVSESQVYTNQADLCFQSRFSVSTIIHRNYGQSAFVTVSTYNDTNCAIAKDTMIYPPPGSYESATCVSHSGAIVVGFIFLCPGQVTTTTTMTTLPSTTRTTVPTATTAVTGTTRSSHADRAAAYWLLLILL